jgi:hypothetical protein
MMNTHTGRRLKAILVGQPLHLMYEEDKKSPYTATNLDPLLRLHLNGTKRAYPAKPRATCDVVFTLDYERIWMECKLVVTHNGGSRHEWRFEDPNINFEKHLGLRESKHHSAIRDIRDRLPTLDGTAHADRIGFLLVTFDSPRLPIDEAIQKFVQRGGLSSWIHDVILSQDDPRDKAKPESARIQILYWERPVRAITVIDVPDRGSHVLLDPIR